MSTFGLNDAELAFLGEYVTRSTTVFEYGSGVSTMYLAPRCRRLITVEHQPAWAAMMTLWAHNDGMHNVTVICCPPNMPYVEGTADDGDLSTFRSYVESYTGKSVDVVIIDGRARVETARYVLERAPFGPSPGLSVFLHDADREQYAPILTMFKEEKRVDRLALLRYVPS